ncbi:MAG TPA: DoxX family membrane protein [Candidatus Limnocylindrales bacterium]|nr:DoxX family membrane protein [Candidatus Limnocylindrales bacterium]
MEITGKIHQRGMALLRITVGIIFLWAGLEKLLAPEAFTAAGFLQFATGGTLGWPFVAGEVAEGTIFNPTHDLWVSLAANESAMTLINVLVPFGQVGIGVSLILGLFTRFGAAMGALMMLFFFFAAWDFAYGVVNQHLTYALICASIYGLGAGRFYGLDGILADRFPAGFRKWFMSGDTVATQPGAAQPVPA